MVVLLPLSSAEHTACCTRCRTTGLCSPTNERSTFYPYKRLADPEAMVYGSYCRRCSNENKRASERRHPERTRATHRAQQRRRWKTMSEEQRERRRKKSREYIRANPVAIRERRRQARAEAKQRQWQEQQQQRREQMQQDEAEDLRKVDWGLEQLAQGKVEVADMKTGHSGIRYPAEPFISWIDARIEELRCTGTRNPSYALSRILRVAEKRFSEWRALDTVDESTVDRALSRDGRYVIRDLYPAPRVAYAAAMFWAAQSPSLGAEVVVVERGVVECRSPGCDAERNGGLFCHEHTEGLARIRKELEAEGALMSANGGASRRACKAGPSGAPVCCNPDCWHGRVRGERFCADCRAEGWVEDDDGILLEEVGV